MPKVTVIIPSLYEKDGEYLKLCVESLRKTVDWDIVVVTNGGHQPKIMDKIHGITRHLHTRDQGQCIAVNTGAANSPISDYYFVSNADMYYAPGWNRYLRFDHLVFSPNLIEPTNNAGSAPPFLKYNGGLTLEEFEERIGSGKSGELQTRRDAVNQFVRLSPETGRETTGFNLPFFIRSDVWQTIGGYDERYDPWGSNGDTDLQTLIELAGIQPMRLRDVLVYHFSNKSGTFDGSHQQEWQRNWDYYTAKFGFNRDMEPRPDTWMATDLVNKKLNRFHPKWEGKYSE